MQDCRSVAFLAGWHAESTGIFLKLRLRRVIMGPKAYRSDSVKSTLDLPVERKEVASPAETISSVQILII